MRNNGNLLKNALLAYLAAMGEDELIDWVKTHVSFPCSMVDRITPRSTPALGDEIKAIYPEHAVAPIHAETFMQWVIQDHFAGDRPDWQKVGVQVVADVEPFEEAKIRILNGGHTGLAYLGALAGHQTFDQAKRDPELGCILTAGKKPKFYPGWVSIFLLIPAFIWLKFRNDLKTKASLITWNVFAWMAIRKWPFMSNQP